MNNKIDPCDTMRVNLIAAAVGLQQCTKTESNIVPIPGGDRVIAIGTPAEVRGLLRDVYMPTDPLRLAVRDMARLLAAGEWAEHVSCDPDLEALETKITELVGQHADLRAQLSAARAAVLKEAALAAEKVQDDYTERQGGKWPELRDDAATGAGDCATAIRALAAPVAPTELLTRCAASRDGECGNAQCPQLRDGEPAKSGRHCPLDSEGSHHD